jgi:signal transduction histidine kinase
MSMIVADNGSGFEPQLVQGGNGLRNLKSRAAAIRGKLEIHSSPGQGTKVIFKAKTT